MKSNNSKAMTYLLLVVGIFVVITVGKFFFYGTIGSFIENFIKDIF
ncbi:hypothetical protein [Solibacillus sp. CAU 1738]